ncbi:hypothetical protein SLS54_000616 [Diplodia seriata]
MDASSLILSLPSSISGAVDFGQRIHYAREFRLESSDAATQLRVLTWHLDEWKRSVGITEDGKLKDEHDEALDYPEVLGLVEDHMRSIQEHRRNLERRLLKLGVEVSSKRKALKTIPGNRLLWKPEDGREKPPLPTPKGISWGFGRDKLVRNELDSMTRAIDDLFKLVPPKASPLEKQAEETMKAEEERCTVLIDGFDEFDRSYRVQSKFLQKIKQVSAQTTTNILVTSRDEEDIQDALSSNPRGASEVLLLECFVSKELVKKDLDRLASEVIERQLHSKPNQVKIDLASRLAERSDGMFLWITQQSLGQLRPGKPLRQLQQIVDKMPTGLKETYRKKWNEINGYDREDQERTSAILRLVAFALRPLTVAEITEALLVKQDHDNLSLDGWPDEIDDEYIKGEIKGKSAVHYAASGDSTGVLRLLLDAVSDLDSLMDNPLSPFNRAALGGNTEILRIFLEKRPAEYFNPDFEGRTALHMAACGGKLAAFEMLLASGFEPSARDARGRNILHYASMSPSAALIEKILQLPCSANLLKQESYFTPLHWAARAGNAHVVAALVTAGVQETRVKTDYPKRGTNWTPWALAKFFNNEMLLSETKSPFTLRDNSPSIGTGKEYYGFACDSCERLVALITDLHSSTPPSLYSQISAEVPTDPSVAIRQSAIAALPSGASPDQLASLAFELLPAAATAGAKAKRGSTTYDPEVSSKKYPGGTGWDCCPLPTGTALSTRW